MRGTSCSGRSVSKERAKELSEKTVEWPWDILSTRPLSTSNDEKPQSLYACSEFRRFKAERPPQVLEFMKQFNGTRLALDPREGIFIS